MLEASDIVVQLPATAEGKRAKETIAVSLYAEGLLTQNQAAKLLDASIREFQKLLQIRHISHMGYMQDETQKQLLAILDSDG